MHIAFQPYGISNQGILTTDVRFPLSELLGYATCERYSGYSSWLSLLTSEWEKAGDEHYLSTVDFTRSSLGKLMLHDKCRGLCALSTIIRCLISKNARVRMSVVLMIPSGLATNNDYLLSLNRGKHFILECPYWELLPSL